MTRALVDYVLLWFSLWFALAAILGPPPLPHALDDLLRGIRP